MSHFVGEPDCRAQERKGSRRASGWAGSEEEEPCWAGPGVHFACVGGAEWLPMDHPQQIRNLRATAFSVSCKTPNL